MPLVFKLSKLDALESFMKHKLHFENHYLVF